MEGASNEYDFNSAVTFFLVGLGVGTALGIAFKPKPGVLADGPNGIKEWHPAESHPQEETTQRVT
jgi:hypothetical protein